jgi:hypothetical protein
MKNIKNKLLVVLTLTTATSIIPHGGYGGGFATGALVGTGITLAATSGNRGQRSDAYYENQRIRRSESEIKSQIREEERKLKKSKRELEREENKNENKRDEDRIKDLKENIKLSKQTTKELREDLRDLR